MFRFFGNVGGYAAWNNQIDDPQKVMFSGFCECDQMVGFWKTVLPPQLVENMQKPAVDGRTPVPPWMAETHPKE